MGCTVYCRITCNSVHDYVKPHASKSFAVPSFVLQLPWQRRSHIRRLLVELSSDMLYGVWQQGCVIFRGGFHSGVLHKSTIVTGQYDSLHIQAYTKWPLFRRRHFQMQEFLERIVNISIEIYMKCMTKSAINNKSALVHVMERSSPERYGKNFWT